MFKIKFVSTSYFRILNKVYTLFIFIKPVKKINIKVIIYQFYFVKNLKALKLTNLNIIKE